MMDRDLNKVLAVATAAAAKAGEYVAQSRSGGTFGVRYKGTRDLLTEADIGSEKIVLALIREAFPNDGIISEEASPNLQTDYDRSGPFWIIDPIDGTTNFAQGHHHVGVSIAFALDGVVQVGVVAAPFLSETFTAVRGQGAFCNGKRIAVSTETSIENSLIGTGFPYKREDLDLLLFRFARVLRACRDIRRFGAASVDLCLVACGRLQGFYETLAPWDIAAGCLIAREAGATIGHSSELPQHLPVLEEIWGEELVVTCPGIYEQLQSLLER